MSYVGTLETAPQDNFELVCYPNQVIQGSIGNIALAGGTTLAGRCSNIWVDSYTEEGTPIFVMYAVNAKTYWTSLTESDSDYDKVFTHVSGHTISSQTYHYTNPDNTERDGKLYRYTSVDGVNWVPDPSNPQSVWTVDELGQSIEAMIEEGSFITFYPPGNKFVPIPYMKGSFNGPGTDRMIPSYWGTAG